MKPYPRGRCCDNVKREACRRKADIVCIDRSLIEIFMRGTEILMGKIRTVDDLLKAKKLTREEWELFRDLIEETKDREKKIARCSAQTKENLKRLSIEIGRTLEQAAILSKSLEKTLDEMESHYLRTMPAHKFYRE